MPLDKLTLDDMVQKCESSDDAWNQLLLDPNREEKWKKAVETREQLDWFCSLVASHPKMARIYRNLRNALKSTLSSPVLSFDIINHEVQPLTATLSPSDIKLESNNLLQFLSWGDQRIIEFNTSLSLYFKCDESINIYYEYSGGSGWMTSKDSWELKLSEGPVMLTFCRGDKGEIKKAIEQSDSVGCVILLPKK